MTWRQIERLRRKYERKYLKQIKEALSEQVTEVLEGLNAGSVLLFDQKIPSVIRNKKLIDVFNIIYKDVGWEFYNQFKRQKEDLERSLWDESYEAYVKESISKKVAMTSFYSVELLQKYTRQLIQQGMEEGLGILDIERLIRNELPKEFSKDTRWRSLRIAQTEVMSASNLANLKAGEDSGLIMRKRWHTAPFGIAKQERHNLYPELQEQRPIKGEPFRFGGYEMQCPGDPNGGAENVINCRCFFSRVTEEI